MFLFADSTCSRISVPRRVSETKHHAEGLYSFKIFQLAVLKVPALSTLVNTHDFCITRVYVSKCMILSVHECGKCWDCEQTITSAPSVCQIMNHHMHKTDAPGDRPSVRRITLITSVSIAQTRPRSWRMEITPENVQNVWTERINMPRRGWRGEMCGRTWSTKQQHFAG